MIEEYKEKDESDDEVIEELDLFLAGN